MYIGRYVCTYGGMYVHRVVSAACNVSADRLGARATKRGVYWWSEELAQSRRRCVAARRLLCRAKRRNRPYMDLANVYRKARSTFAKMIRKAKAESWDALLRSLDDDPWGIPYKLVMDRLRTSGLSLLESLEPPVVERLLNDLFPRGEVHDPDALWGEGVDWNPEYVVSGEEVRMAIRARKRGGCPAPGPDGLSLVVWRCVPCAMVDVLAALFTRCLETGRVPNCWKRAILVLIPKGQFDSVNPKARPICLLNEVSKLFERILDRRLKNFKAGIRTSDRPARVLSTGMQFGFTEGVSTTDALKAVTKFISNKLDKKRFVIAVSLDVRNAFNSISWEAIRWALGRDGYPAYLRRVLDGYLCDRFIDYPVRSGDLGSRRVTCGVPQGSVLGPLLWNIAYGFVLRLKIVSGAPGCVLVGYADDTLVLCSGASVGIVQSSLNTFMPYLLRRMDRLSLSVAAEKTEAVLFCGRRRADFADPLLRIGDVWVSMRPHMKYLGMMVDRNLNFRCHLKYIGDKVGKMTRALSRLLPNLRGPHEGKRRLYANVVASVVLYAAPVWAPALNTSSHLRSLLRRWQRTVALRTCAAYRSVSWDSATLLSRLVPYELLAAERFRMYERWQDAKENGEASPEVLADIRTNEKVITRRQWTLLISRPGAAGRRLRDALLPHIGSWMTRSWGVSPSESLNFYLVTGTSALTCFVLAERRPPFALSVTLVMTPPITPSRSVRIGRWRGALSWKHSGPISL